MRIKLLILIFCGVLLFCCNKTNAQGSYLPMQRESRTPSLCDTEQCKKYQQIWQEIFLERNNISKKYFKNNIEIINSSIYDWDEGTAFDIGYYVKNNWVKAYIRDNFVIKINEGNKWYPHLHIPRGKYLSKSEITSFLIGEGLCKSCGAFSSKVQIGISDTKLKFNSEEDAISYLIRETNEKTLCPNRINIDERTGRLLLYASAIIDFGKNECVYATLDLIDGSTTVTKNACVVS